MLAHPIYLIRHFLGEFESYHLDVGKVGEYSWMKSDELVISFKCGNKLGRAYASFNAPRKAIYVSLYGKDAILKLDVINATLSILPKKKGNRFNKGFDSIRQATQIIKSTAKNAGKIAFGSWQSGHEKCIQLFAESVINDIDVPVTIDEGFEVVKSVEEMGKEIEKAEALNQKSAQSN
jgi:predicted dehydrogenase